jgi:hypothetical protein
MTAKKESLNINDSITITTPIGKVVVLINGDGIEVDLSKPEALVSVVINGTNVSKEVRNHGGRSRNQQVQIINGCVNGGQIAQSNGDIIQIQNNRYR